MAPCWALSIAIFHSYCPTSFCSDDHVLIDPSLIPDLKYNHDSPDWSWYLQLIVTVHHYLFWRYLLGFHQPCVLLPCLNLRGHPPEWRTREQVQPGTSGDWWRWRWWGSRWHQWRWWSWGPGRQPASDWPCRTGRRGCCSRPASHRTWPRQRSSIRVQCYSHPASHGTWPRQRSSIMVQCYSNPASHRIWPRQRS